MSKRTTSAAAAASRAIEIWPRFRMMAAMLLAAAAALGGCAPSAGTASGSTSRTAVSAGTITSPAQLALAGRVPPPGIQTAGEARTLASAIPAAIGAADQSALLPFDDAVTRAAEALFANARLPAPTDPSGRHLLVIDPLIDGANGSQSASTRNTQARVVEVAQRFPQYDLRPFNTASLESKPLVLLGSLMPLRPGNVMIGAPTAYDLWLVLADTRTGRIVGRSEAPMRVAGVDPTPTPFFRESPVWVKEDPSQRGYWETCRSVVGDAVDSRYLEGLFASALVADGINAYEAGKPWQALAFYQRAAQTPGGDQMRVHNGLYLANWAVGRKQEAEAAFARVVDFGLRQGQLSVKLVFQPASTAFWPDGAVSGAYPIWLRSIAHGAVVRETCLQVTGHTSPTGSPAVNDRLSLARAQRVQGLLVRSEPPLAQRTAAKGAGSREPIIGTGADDASDALDRRVEFAPRGCGTVAAENDWGAPVGG